MWKKKKSEKQLNKKQNTLTKSKANVLFRKPTKCKALFKAQEVK